MSNLLNSENIWLVVGFFGQLLFSMRFILQWLASERIKRSVIPHMFWYFSLAGGIVLFIYAIYRRDPVFILGQGAGIFIYLRNIYFILRESR
ncbi:MAG: lipid-A-disaccharide synthase N-terminal domain-containing protein [Gammaproteobacteria bacterium]|nr:lipid-A-disaccharide synthase N-terminal domain-containing protein [Gammaproteobacteria bacterium]MCD8525568.1 lipid-A-disaccharide synthase N-terminal domain-containing protein [Gammaproteobacteria bacterium]MCD8542275.1 lipid-A-disaccharide synthase N-terminal domain-containing protein [Gammaproteobacteria bacterium]